MHGMKKNLTVLLAGGIAGGVFLLHAQNAVQPDQQRPLFENRMSDSAHDDEALARQDRAAIAQVRASEVAMMKGVKFGEECTTLSEPSDRLLFEHEGNVNSFLGIGMKLGLGRYLIVHLSNPRLATHGGVINSTLRGDNGWNEHGSHYSLTRPWGMIGDLDQNQPKAYLFRPSPYLRLPAKEGELPAAAPEIEEYAVNPFEDHALSLLRKGEKIVRWEQEDTMHAVGAIRSEAQCLRCHAGKTGDLLGAFTYSFAKSKAAMPDDKTKQLLKLHDEGKTLFQIAMTAGLLKEKDAKESSDSKAVVIASYEVQSTLLKQGVVTAEMLAEQKRRREQLLNTELGPVKEPRKRAGAE